MTLPQESTLVTYPVGGTSSTGTVLHVAPIAPADGAAASLFAVILDVTPCHPVDAGWPDQPADRGSLEWNNGGETRIVDSVVGATDGVDLYLGADIPVRKGTEGWIFVVAHVVDVAPPEGIVVTVKIDEKYRKAISLGHTACHLAALALNAALEGRWAKPVGLDGLGAPNFDDQANDTSVIVERGSRDSYRLGKSLRKKGFKTDGIAEDLAAIEAAVNGSLEDWVRQKAPVTIEREGDRLTDRRFWICKLSEGTPKIACGGTHATHLGELKGLTARLSLTEADGTAVLLMETEID